MTPTEFELATLAEVNRRARAAAADAEKAGIAAAVVRDGRVLAYGANEVFKDNDPTRHAEIVAIGRACAELGAADLSGATLISSLQPCEMCLTAIRLSGIGRILFAAEKANVAPKYFVFPALSLDDFRAAAKDPDFAWSGGHRQDEVLDLYVDGQE